MFNYANVSPFEMDSISDLPNIDNSNITLSKNYGLNLNFSISYDMTSFIKQHMLQFAECFQRQFEFDILGMFVYNPDAVSSLRERNLDYERLVLELKSFDFDTVVRKLSNAKKRLKATLSKLGYKDNAFVANEEDNFTIGSI